MIIFCIVVFLVAMIVVGYVATKKVKNSNDYYLGNKEFGPFATAFKFASTWESGSKLVGSPGQAYAGGMTAFLQGLTSPLAYFMSFRVFGPRLKAASDYYDVITVPEMLGKRYHSQTVHTVSSLALLVGLMGTLLGQFQSIGNVVGTVLEIPYVPALVGGVAIIGLYTVFGGYRASVWTDMAQGACMVGGSILIFIFVIKEAGNWSLPSLNEQLNAIQPTMLHLTGGAEMTVLTLCTFLIIPLFMGIALPQQSVAIFSMKDRRVGNASLIICVLFSTVLIWGLYLAAMTARTMDGFVAQSPDAVTTTLAIQYMPKVLAGLFIAAILAAIMSTCDGVLLVASSILTRDIFRRIKPDVYEKHAVAYNRLATMVVCVIPLFIAIKPPAAVFWVVSFAMALTVFTFALPMLGIIAIRRATKEAALAQIIVVVLLIPAWVIFGLDKATGISALAIGMLAAPVVFFPVMLLTKPPASDPETDRLWEIYGEIREERRQAKLTRKKG